MRRFSLSPLFALAAAATAGLLLAMGGPANAVSFTYDDGAAGSGFHQANNWNPNGTLTNADDGTISGNFVSVRSAAGDTTTARLTVGGGAQVNVTGGTHGDVQTGGYNDLGVGSEGTIDQTGGDYTIGHMLRIGGGGAGGDGTYLLSGGSLNVFRAGASELGAGDNHSIMLGDLVDAGSGLMEISGGSLETRRGLGIGTTGVFSVVGSVASSIGIGSFGSGDGNWLQLDGGTLSARIDGGGVTSIFVDDVGGGSVVVDFQSGSLLDLGFEGIAPVLGTWTLLEAENADIIDGGLGLTGNHGGWTFDIDNSGANGLLTVTYLPEPSTLLLFGAGLAGLAVQGRRRTS